MKTNYTAVSYKTNEFCTVIEVNNYPTMNEVVNFPRVSRAEFLTPEDRKSERFIVGYWTIKKLKK